MQIGQKPLRYKAVLRFLSIASLILIIFNSISLFVSVSSTYTTYNVRFIFPSFLSWILIVLNLAPALLFVIFAFTGRYTSKVNPIIPAIFSILAVGTLYNLFRNSTMLNPLGIMFYTTQFIAYVLLFIASINRFKNKYLTIIPTVICLVWQSYSLYSCIAIALNRYDRHFFWYLCLYSTIYLGMITFLIAFLLFALTNGVPSYVSNSKRNFKIIQDLSPEKALKLLNTKLELGMITEEEYKEDRAKIIESL